MSLALLKLASPKNLLKLATAYEETEEFTGAAVKFRDRMADKSPAEWGPGEIEIAYSLIAEGVEAGSAWKSALKPVYKLLRKYLRKAKEKP